MDAQTEIAYNKFKEDPFGFTTLIAKLNAVDNGIFIPSLVVTKQWMIKGYILALYDNGLITDTEYHNATDYLQTHEHLLKELS